MDDTLYHFEWWAGWAQFSSDTTALFWSPQHALPAWLGVALLMHSRDRLYLLPYAPLMVSATLLWSPFATVGLAPFILTLLIRHGEWDVVVGWRTLLSLVLLALPVGLYLSAGTGAIPHGFIWAVPCTDEPCFTWGRYALFLLIEVGTPMAILFARALPEQGFLVTATVTLCLIPLYRIGIFNDFAMRASLPSLAVLAILSAKLVSGRSIWSTGVVVLLLLSLPSVLGEFARGFLVSAPREIDLQSMDVSGSWWIDQTFVTPPIWVLR